MFWSWLRPLLGPKNLLIGAMITIVSVMLVDYVNNKADLAIAERELAKASGHVSAEKEATERTIRWHREMNQNLEILEDERNEEWGDTPLPDDERKRLRRFQKQAVD